MLGAAFSLRLDLSIIDTLACLRVTFKHFHYPRFGSHVFRGGGVPNLLGTVAARNDFALLGYITTSRWCWQACPVSIDRFPQQSRPCRDIDLCENSVASMPGNRCCRLPRRRSRTGGPPVPLCDHERVWRFPLIWILVSNVM